MLALGSSLAAVVPHCEHVVEYSSLTGEISVGGDAGYAACGWHIQPNRRLQRIAFPLTALELHRMISRAGFDVTNLAT